MTLPRRCLLGLGATLALAGPALAGGRTSPPSASRGENLFPNTQWQLTTALPPGFNGDPQGLQAHLDSFATQWDWRDAGPLPPILVLEVTSQTDPASGIATVTVQGDANVRFLHPGAVVVFAASAPAALRVSPMRVRTVDYTRKTFTLLPPRNGQVTSRRLNTWCRPIMRCDQQGITGHGPDGWSKSVSAHLWVDRFPSMTNAAPFITLADEAGPEDRPAWTSNLRPSMKRCVVIVPQDGSDTRFFHTLRDAAPYRGRRLTIGMWVRGRAGGRARLFFDDGRERRSEVVEAQPDWRWLEMSEVVSATAQALSVGLVMEDSGGAAWRIGDATLIQSGMIGEDGYSRPLGRIERFVVKMTPDAWFGADFSFGSRGGVLVDFAGETGLAIAEDVPLIFGIMEGSADQAGRPLVTRNQFNPPHRFGALIHATTAGRPVAQSAVFDLANDGTMWLESQPGAVWRDVSFDLNQAVLS